MVSRLLLAESGQCGVMHTPPRPVKTEQPKEARVHVNVNLDGLLGSLHRDVQRATNLVAVGIQSPVVLDEESLAIRSDPISFRFGNSPPWASSDDARSDYQDWVYGNGLRDVLEGVGIRSLRALGDTLASMSTMRSNSLSRLKSDL